MAIGRISGQVLRSALYRDGIDIYFANTQSDTELLYLNVNDNRIGINNGAPTYELDVTGTIGSTAIQTLQINVGDLLLQNNQMSSTNGDLILTPATGADKISLDANVDITSGLTVDQNIESTNGTIIAATLEIAGVNLSQDVNGDQRLTTDLGNFVIEPAAGSSFIVDGPAQFNGAVELTGGNDLVFTNSLGALTLTLDGETGNLTTAGLLQPEELQVGDIFIHDNVIEVNTPDVDLIIKAGDPDSSGSAIPNIVLQSETTIIKPFRVNGAEAKIIIDGMLEIDNNQIEAYASDLNLTVNNLGDSTTNFINLNGDTQSRGSIFVRDEVVSPNIVVDSIEATTNDINVYPSENRFFIINENLQVIKDIQGTYLNIDDIIIDLNQISSQSDLNLTAFSDITLTAGGNIALTAGSNNDVFVNSDTFFNGIIEVPILRSSDTIEGNLLEIDNVRIDGNAVSSITGPLNLRVNDPLSESIFFNTNLEVQGNIHATGSITADGDLILGDADTDNITLNADINSNILPDINSDGNTGTTIGSSSKYWKDIYTKNLTLSDYTVNEINNDDFTLNETDDLSLVTEGAIVRYVNREIDALEGNTINLGPSKDSTYTDGAFFKSATVDENGFSKIDEITENIKIAEAIDLLNEAMNNIRNNTFIRSVDFTAVPTAAGSGSQITLNLDVDGTHNRIEVDWDVDGRFAQIQSILASQSVAYTPPANANNSVYTGNLSSVSFVYDAPLGGFFTVKVVVRNTSAQIPGSAGTDAEETKIDYLTIYTPDPVVDFDLYRVSSNGTVLSGNNLYVIENNGLFLSNQTTNTGGIFPNTATYEVDWGDGTAIDVVSSDSAPGGRFGSRLSHVFPDSSQTGTGLTNVTLTITTHTTADPEVIPSSKSVAIKIYEDNPIAPASLNTKTIGFGNTSVNGTAGAFAARLASGATINAASPVATAGSLVNRTIKTTGTIESTVISTFAYSHIGNVSDFDGNNPPILSAIVNGTDLSSRTFVNSLGNNTVTVDDLVVTQESDYNLLNSAGSSISFNTSTFYPDAFYGFKAKVALTASTTPVGLNSFKLSFTAPTGTFETNNIEFVKDDLTALPVVSGGIIQEGNAGTYRYISGIPYYNTGNPNLIVSNLQVLNFIGQTYADITNVLEVSNGSNAEGTTSAAIGTFNYNYSQINNSFIPFLLGSVPLSNTGIGSPYVLGSVSVPITTSLVRTVDTVRFRVRTVNGTSAYLNQTKLIAVHRSAQFGISEIAIAVSDSLGNGVFLDDAKRIFDFASISLDNPTFSSTGVNYYTANPYTESSNPGVEGTQESTIRLGILEHNVSDYRDYLPVGPNRSGDTGRQYFTMAFRRQVVANFSISITSTTGVAGVWIAAPGTAIDNASTINGWLDCSAQYAGAGVPGADTSNGGNGSNGCAITGADRITLNSSINKAFNMTLGSENLSNSSNNVCLVRIALNAGQKITALSIGVA